ncbi:CYTH domain-containing protein [Desulfogranum mediterraneum]|uniref:CYTH domain-containing protein n=1 Tax=Desulfogranum mediterraneum TaxID=160661 RepID=UPI0004127BB9
MGIEIERKFLVSSEEWRQQGRGKVYCQGYIHASKERTVRVRLVGDQGYLTIKGASVGPSRMEFEYPIPPEDAMVMLEQLCEPPLIEKKRYLVEHEGFTWEVDEFFGENQGLIVAEIELESEEQSFARPPWLGMEVTDDSRYFNARLASYPYSSWPRESLPRQVDPGSGSREQR